MAQLSDAAVKQLLPQDKGLQAQRWGLHLTVVSAGATPIVEELVIVVELVVKRQAAGVKDELAEFTPKFLLLFGRACTSCTRDICGSCTSSVVAKVAMVALA